MGRTCEAVRGIRAIETEPSQLFQFFGENQFYL
jgi:hypothetical protein